MEDWNFKGVTDNKVLCSWDFRTDNIAWRKIHPKLDDYDCEPAIDALHGNRNCGPTHTRWTL